MSDTRLWDTLIPPEVIIPARTPGRKEPEGEALILKRVPDADFALYSVAYGPEKLAGKTNGKAHALVVHAGEE